MTCRIKVIDSPRFIDNSLSNLVNNLDKGFYFLTDKCLRFN